VPSTSPLDPSPVAVVTGAGHGIGRASARRFAANGYRVVAVDRDLPGAQATVAGLGDRAIALEADIREPAQIAAYTEGALAAFGRVDAYHLNAGVISSLLPFAEVPLEEFDATIAINLRGTFVGTQYALRQLQEQGTGGAIVVTTSIHGLRAATDLVAYQITKHGLTGLVGAAAMAGAPHGIRVNAVAPGVIPTPDDAAIRADMERRSAAVPARRAGTVDEIADAVVFLAGPGATYIHGQVLSVDGGASIVNTVRPSGGAGAWLPE
jgi:NAD(P)-dependent dehydrogenase (short-subunit alcohol dehydrogenase family)